MTKAFWMATEILQARTPDELQRHHGVTVIPSEPGTFRITANVVVDSMLATSRDGDDDDDDDDHNGDDNTNTNTNVLFPKTRVVQLWERKADGGFPPIDLIEFEERVRACLDDNGEGSIVGAAAAAVAGSSTTSTTSEEDAADPIIDTNNDSSTAMVSSKGDTAAAATVVTFSHVVIKYCPSSGYLRRAAYYGQELLTTFDGGEPDAVSLVPIIGDEENNSTGSFSVELRDPRGIFGTAREMAPSPRTSSWSSSVQQPLVLWNSTADSAKRFPEVKELKRLVRDTVTPQKDLGHSEEERTSDTNTTGEEVVESPRAATTATTTTTTTNEIAADDVGDCIPCNAAATASGKENDEDSDDDDDDDDDDECIDDDEAEDVRRYFGVM